MTDQIQDQLDQYVNNFTVKPAFYEQKPQILNHLTYIEESKDKEGNPVFYRKRLKAAWKEVYMVITEIAGEAVCFKTEEYIANMAGCSKETVSAAKKAFTFAFEQLDGGSLMTINERRVMTSVKDDIGETKNVNKRPVHVCGIEWIWHYNNAYMKTKRENKDYEVAPMKEILTAKEAELAIEKMGQQSAIQLVHKQGAELKKQSYPRAEQKNQSCSPGGRTEKTARHKTSKQNPLVKEQDPMAEAIQMSLINQKNVEECFASQCKANEFLEILGFTRRVITDLLGKYSLSEMLASVCYMKKQFKKTPVKTSITGYFLTILDKQYWKPKAT